MIVKCIVSGINANGEPDFYFVKVNCTQKQYDNELHYRAAKNAADDEGYESFIAFDENDSAGKAILDKFEWDSASTVIA